MHSKTLLVNFSSARYNVVSTVYKFSDCRCITCDFCCQFLTVRLSYRRVSVRHCVCVGLNIFIQNVTHMMTVIKICKCNFAAIHCKNKLNNRPSVSGLYGAIVQKCLQFEPRRYFIIYTVWLKTSPNENCNFSISQKRLRLPFQYEILQDYF